MRTNLIFVMLFDVDLQHPENIPNDLKTFSWQMTQYQPGGYPFEMEMY